MSSFTAAQLSELNQMFAAVAQQRGFLRVPSGGSAFTPQQRSELMGMILNVVGDAQKGRYPGFGNPQVDTYNYPDNCTASFPWNFDFVIPKNFQRWTAVHFSFHLSAFRRYVSSVNTTTSSTTPHTHTWVQGGVARTIAYQLGMDSGGNPGMSGAVPPPFGFVTATEAPAGATGFSSFTTVDFNGAGHSHTISPTLATGIFQDTTPTSVNLAIDGTDKTSVLGGPWTADAVELDITSVMPTTTGTFHNITLTPNQNGRITGELRFSYFVDASVPA